MGRLDTQRAPVKAHARPNARYYQRGYALLPHPTWGESTNLGAVPATGATAGIPGTWTPAGSTPPASPALLSQSNPVVVVASPTTAWTTGQYVQTQTAGVAGRACWTGTAWVSGAAP